MSYNNIRFHVDGDGIALLTIHRPEKLNALSPEILAELETAFHQAAGAAEIRALILTGAGEKAFVAGADIQHLSRLTPVEAQQYAAYGQKIFRILEQMPKPSVAAVNGYALGGGLELAMAATIRVASPNARLGQPEVKLGILPGYGGTQRLPRLVGRGRALDLLLTGEPIDAAEAQRIGLVNYVVPQPELLAFCQGWLKKVLANGPIAVALAMQAVDTGLDASLEQGLQWEAAAFGLASATGDRTEGMRAFLEKRRPVFAGK